MYEAYALSLFVRPFDEIIAAKRLIFLNESETVQNKFLAIYIAVSLEQIS